MSEKKKSTAAYKLEARIGYCHERHEFTLLLKGLPSVPLNVGTGIALCMAYHAFEDWAAKAFAMDLPLPDVVARVKAGMRLHTETLDANHETNS